MTTRTRRLVFISFLVLLFALPAETILVRALMTPQPQDAVAQWVDGLDQEKLAATAAQIQFFPFTHRREVMRRLTPASRSSIWRGHLTSYRQIHPELDLATVGAIRAAAEVLSPAFFAAPTDEQRESLRSAAERIQASIGRDETEYLLYRLGPVDGTFASFEPLALSLSNRVRGWFVANAAAGNCDCYSDFGCYGANWRCLSGLGCSADNNWPMCGWGWATPCDGNCVQE